LAEALVLETS